MSEDKCPFCGADSETDPGVMRSFICGFIPGYSRSSKCYEAEIANLKGVVKTLVIMLDHYVIPDDLGAKKILNRPDVAKVLKEGDKNE